MRGTKTESAALSGRNRCPEGVAINSFGAMSNTEAIGKCPWTICTEWTTCNSAIGQTKNRPVGTQMRHYLASNGKPYTELMVFKNYEGGIDVYVRPSAWRWQSDLWTLYKINDQSMPEDWHKSYSMCPVSNDVCPMDKLRDKKRKRDDSTMKGEDKIDAGFWTAMAAKSTAIDSASTEPINKP